jgi:hypothetical protein
MGVLVALTSYVSEGGATILLQLKKKKKKKRGATILLRLARWSPRVPTRGVRKHLFWGASFEHENKTTGKTQSKVSLRVTIGSKKQSKK